MTSLTHPHRLSSSELERGLYISNSPLHRLLFEREEPFPRLSEEELSKPEHAGSKALKARGEYLETKKDIQALRDANFTLQENQQSLLSTVHQLCLELEYTTDKDLATFLAGKLAPSIKKL